MFLVYGITLILAGVLGAAGYIVSKRPDAADAIEKIRPIQGWLGVVVCLWGIFIVISILLATGLLSTAPILWITVLATGIVMVLLGFLLGYGLIQQYALSGNASAAARGEEVRGKIIGYQTTLGLIAIGLGVWTIVAALIF